MSVGPEERERNVRSTPITGAAIVGSSVVLGTIFADDGSATFRPLHANGAAVVLDGSEPFYSQRAVIHAAKVAGSANFRTGAFSLNALAPHLASERQYADVFAFIDYASVAEALTDDEKSSLKDKVAAFYGIDR